jgi:hypothetical protein
MQGEALRADLARCIALINAIRLEGEGDHDGVVWRTIDEWVPLSQVYTLSTLRHQSEASVRAPR